MKNTVVRFALALMALVVSTGAFAASDYLLEIEGIKGESEGKRFKLTEQADGTWTAENIPAGTYKLVAKPKTVRKTGAAPLIVDFHHECIVSPRDVATGQSSGKRQHKPSTTTIQKMGVNLDGETSLGDFVVVKQWDASTGGTPTAAGQKTAGYDLKVAKKV